MIALVVEIGRHLANAAVGSVLIVTVGGALGAWRHEGVPRSLDGLLFGENDRDRRASDASAAEAKHD